MNNTKGLKICFSLLAIIVLCTCYIGCLLTSNELVHADYEDILLDSNALVNFNQMINIESVGANMSYYDTCVFVLDVNVSSYRTVNITDFTFINTHYYYIKTNNTQQNLMSFTNNGSIVEYINGDFIFHYINNNLSITDIYLDSGFTSGTYYVNVIDLTQMFGSNEPNLEQCQDLFVADYYNYNTGSAISLSGLNSFADGVNSVLSSLDSVYDSATLLKIVQPYYDTYKNSFIQYYTMTGNSPETLFTDTICIYNACFIPFLTSVPSGTYIQFSAQSISEYNIYDTPLSIYYLTTDNNLILVDNLPEGIFTGYNLDFITIKDSVGLVFLNDSMTNYYFLIDKPTLSYRVNNLSTLLNTSYKSGYDKASIDLKSYYSPGGVGYQAIYDKGYYDYPTDDHFTFQKLISSVIDVPIQAFTNLFDYDILGVNMKTFYLSIFTLCVIITIIRLVL